MSDLNKWRERQQQFRLANARQWIESLQTSSDSRALVIQEYDNLLRSLETLLQDPRYFDLAYELIQLLYPIVFGYADWERWQVYLDQALQWSQQGQDREKEGRLWEQLGDLRRHRNELDEATIAYRQALTLFKQHSKVAAYAAALSKLASLYQARGQVAEANTLCQEILPLAHSTADERVIAHLNITLSQIHIQLRQWEEGLQAASVARRAYQSAGNALAEARAMSNMVACWANLEMWDEAQQTAAQVMAVYTAAADLAGQIRLQTNLGVIAYKQGRLAVAEETWQDALRLTTQTQESEMLPLLQNNLGMVYRDMEEWAAAEEMLAASAGAYQALGDVAGWANALDNLAELYEGREEWELCRQTLRRALAGLEPHAAQLAYSRLIPALQQRLSRIPPLP